jgi:hypothetical protein
MIIDLEESIEFPEVMKNKHLNELQTLSNIWRGMCFINKLMEKIELNANEKISDGTMLQNMPPEIRKSFEEKEIRYSSYGNEPIFDWLDKGFLYSLFQWYAVSACNYVLLVGYLAQQVNPKNPKPRNYMYSVIPNASSFRDKIAAHPVRACEDKRDNEADRIASVFYQVGFDKGRFYAPIWQITIGQKKQQIIGEKMGPWSITETHAILLNRYRELIENNSLPYPLID